MFKWIKEKINNYKSYCEKMKKDMEEIKRDEQMEKYYNYVYDHFNKKKKQNIGCFTYDGYKCIYGLLISNAAYKINVFCENYDKIFTDELYPLFYLKAKSGIVIKIITYNGIEDERFRELEKNNVNVFYYNLKFNEENINRCNNFIVVDDCSVWVEDIGFYKREKFEVLKSCVNFGDNLRSAQLIYRFNTFIQRKGVDK